MRLDKRSLARVIEMAKGIEAHYANVQIITNSRLIGRTTEHRLYWLSLALLDLLEKLEPPPTKKEIL